MESASITLTRDELLAFLSIVGASAINGLPDDPLQGLSEEEVETRLNSGEQSLLHRGLIEPQGTNTVVLNDILVALVGGAVIPEATFLLTQVMPDGRTDPHYFGATPSLLIEHHSPRSGIYQFNHLPDEVSLTYRVQTLLAPLHPLLKAGKASNLTIAAAAMSRFLQNCQSQDLGAAEDVLKDEGFPDDVAASLARDCTALPRWVGVVGWGLREEQPSGGDSIMAMMGENGCWLVENIPGEPQTVTVRSVSGSACEEALVALLGPVFQVRASRVES